jgi:hypothetical protein
MVGAWLGATLFIEVGFWGNGIVAALFMGTAVLILYLWVREGVAEAEPVVVAKTQYDE